MPSALPVEVRAGAACTIEYEVREARPTSVTCRLYEPDGTEVTPPPTAYVDPCTTTVTVDWEDGIRTLTLDEQSDMRAGRTYWIKGTRGLWEPVRVIGRGAGAASGMVYLADPPEEAFLASDAPAFVSRRVYCEFTAPETLAERYYVEWTYVLTDPIDSSTITRVERSYFHVVRQPWPVPFLRVDELRAILRQVAQPDYQVTAERGEWFARDVEDAVEVIRSRLLERGLKPWLYKSPTVFQRAAAYEVHAGWVRRGAYLPPGFSDARAAIEHAEGMVTRELELALAVGELYDEDDDGIVETPEATAVRGGCWGRL